jgi:hypothetical protein
VTDKPTYLGRRAVAKTLHIDAQRVELVLGLPDVEVVAIGRDWPAWNVQRVLAFAYEGKVTMPSAAPTRLYGVQYAAERCNSLDHLIRPLLGDPDAIFQGTQGERPLWTGKGVNAALQLVEEARAAGSNEFDRKRSREAIVAARQRNRAERVRAMQLRRLAKRRPTVTPEPPRRKAMICQPLHRQADNLDYQRRAWR